jgi:hypothetical protein
MPRSKEYNIDEIIKVEFPSGSSLEPLLTVSWENYGPEHNSIIPLSNCSQPCSTLADYMFTNASREEKIGYVIYKLHLRKIECDHDFIRYALEDNDWNLKKTLRFLSTGASRKRKRHALNHKSIRRSGLKCNGKHRHNSEEEKRNLKQILNDKIHEICGLTICILIEKGHCKELIEEVMRSKEDLLKIANSDETSITEMKNHISQYNDAINGLRKSKQNVQNV